MSQRPLVAIGAGLAAARKVSRVEAAFVGCRYLLAVERAGGQPVPLAPRPLDEAEAHDLLSRFDALVLMGGPDVAPHHYGQEPHPAVYGVHEGRDAFELMLARVAAERELPTLAICRGLQVANVALGGTLIQHLPDSADGLISHAPEGFPSPLEGILHDVTIEPGSRLAKALGGQRTTGASYHHQAIDRVARGLSVVARSSDGVIEGAEHDNGWFVGVQWHPEDTAEVDTAQVRLFAALVEQTIQR